MTSWSEPSRPRGNRGRASGLLILLAFVATLAVVGATAPDETLPERRAESADQSGLVRASGSLIGGEQGWRTDPRVFPTRRSVSVASSGRAEAAPLTTPASPTVSGTARPDTGIQSHLRFTVPVFGLAVVLFFAWGRLQVWLREAGQ